VTGVGPDVPAVRGVPEVRNVPAAAGVPATPYVCPFCGEEDLRPAPEGLWNCLSCLRVFSLALHGLMSPDPPPGVPGTPSAAASSRRPESHRSHSS